MTSGDSSTSRPALRRFVTDANWWRFHSPSGDTVVAGSPLRLFRFAPGARPLLTSLEKRQPLDDQHWPVGSEQVVERLLDADAIHPQFDDHHQPSLSVSDITVIIPTKDTDQAILKKIVESLAHVHTVIIVDDGSDVPVEQFINHHGTDIWVHRLWPSQGPAAARNAGLAFVKTPLICFIDSDIDLPVAAQHSSFWIPVLAHFDDPRIGLVAPRVQSPSGSSVLERYEVTDSPLDMGSRAARLHPRGRLSYVPSALMLIRSAELRRLGGFDETLRYGEDVDLVWRLTASGVTCRFEPAMTVHHRPRPTWSAFGRQRFLYGTSAARLDARHPGNLAPLRLQSWTGAAWTFGLTGHLVTAALITAISVTRLRRSLPRPAKPNTYERDIIASRVVLRGHLLAGQALAHAVTRPWWPLAALASVRSTRARRLWLLALIVPTLWRWKQRESDLDPLRYTAAKIFDDLSYGSGVWAGALTTQRFGPLRPHFH